MTEHPKEELLDFKYFLARDVVVDFKEGIMRPAVFVLAMTPDSSPDARRSIFRYATDSYIKHLEFLPFAAALVLVENVNAARRGWDVSVSHAGVLRTVKPTTLYKSERSLFGHGQVSGFNAVASVHYLG